jgi:hypothetical protein
VGAKAPQDDQWAQFISGRDSEQPFTAQAFQPQLTPTKGGNGAKKLISVDLPKPNTDEERRALITYASGNTSKFYVGVQREEHDHLVAETIRAGYEKEGALDQPEDDVLMNGPEARAVQNKLLENLNKRKAKAYESASQQSSPTRRVDMFSTEQTSYFRNQVTGLFPKLSRRTLNGLLECRHKKELFISGEVQAELLNAIDFRNVEARNLQGGLSKSMITQTAKNGAIVAAFVPHVQCGILKVMQGKLPQVKERRKQTCVSKAAVANRVAIESKSSKPPCGYCLQQLCGGTATIKFVGASSNKPGRSFAQLVTTHKQCPAIMTGLKSMMLLTDTRRTEEKPDADIDNLVTQGAEHAQPLPIARDQQIGQLNMMIKVADQATNPPPSGLAASSEDCVKLGARSKAAADILIATGDASGKNKEGGNPIDTKPPGGGGYG